MDINLTSLDQSDIKYKVSQFPDGQQSITILGIEQSDDIFSLFGLRKVSGIVIKSRLNSFRDLELIICANQALRLLGCTDIELYIPYFLGARSDRKFQDGGIHYVRDVITPILISQEFTSITVFDPHSDVVEACIGSKVILNKIDNIKLVDFALSKMRPKSFVIVSPDAGALKKIYNVAEYLKTEDIVIASKHRNLEGRITHTEVPGLDRYSFDSTFIIIDDICDGGRTFIELAKVIKSHVWPSGQLFTGKIQLIISHGIFSAGFNEIATVIDGVYCTNSIKDFEGGEWLENKSFFEVNQLNVLF